MTSTCHVAKRGSLGRLMLITAPILLMELCRYLAVFGERWLLWQHDPGSFSAVVIAMLAAAVFQESMAATTTGSEILMSQSEGADSRALVGPLVWQMLRFSLISVVLFWPLALAAPYFIQEAPSAAYFRIVMAFGPLWPMNAVLSGFFVTRGAMRPLLFSMGFGYSCQLAIDYHGIMEGGGAETASLAAVTAQAIQCLFLGAYFLWQGEARTIYHSRRWQFNSKLAYNCVRLGLPATLNAMLDYGAWAIVAACLDRQHDSQQLTLYGLSDSLYWVFSFAMMGLSRSIMHLTAQTIGQLNPTTEEQDSHRMLLRPVLRVWGIWSSFLALVFLAYPQAFLKLLSMAPPCPPYDIAELNWILLCLWLYLTLEGLSWILTGFLKAVGDTRYVLFSSAAAGWLLVVGPVIYLTHQGILEAAHIWLLSSLYAASNLLSLSIRFKTQKRPRYLLSPVLP